MGTPIATRKLSYDHYCSQLQEAVFSRSSKLPSACPLIPEPPTGLPEQERHSRTFIQLLFVTAPRQSQTLQQSLPSAPPAAAKLRSLTFPTSPTQPSLDTRALLVCQLPASTSRTFDTSIASVSTQSTAPQPQSAPQSAVNKQESPTVVGEQQPMTQGVSQQQQRAYGTYSQPQEQHQNLPTINNLINPPQSDGPSQSKPNMGQSEPENGSARQPDQTDQGQIFLNRLRYPADIGD